MKVVGAHADLCGQAAQVGRFVGLFDDLAGAGHQGGMLPGDAGAVGSGALARPVAGGFGLCGGVEELDVFTLGQPRWAAGAAVHAGGLDPVDEGRIGGRVAGQHGLPAWVGLADGGFVSFHVCCPVAQSLELA
ncbi:hypothetical protein D3C85_942410 [compost metagenome]